MKASSQWAFTSYKLNIFEGFTSPTFMKNLCYQFEQCPNTGRHHLQGFISFNRHIRIRQLQRIFHNHKLHAVPALGSPYENREYCTKGESRLPNTQPVVIGKKWSRKRQGKRSDLEILVDMIRQGMTDFDIMSADPKGYLRYNTHIRKCRFTYLGKTLPSYMPCYSTVYWGASRTGKTRRAFHHAGELGSVFKVTFSKDYWLDGYGGESTLIIDEFTGQIMLQNLLTLLDDYKLRCPVKGGFVYRQWTNVFITSNKHPRDWYPEACYEHLNALKNRLHKIVQLGKTFHNSRELVWHDVKGVDEVLVLPSSTSGQDSSQPRITAAFNVCTRGGGVLPLIKCRQKREGENGASRSSQWAQSKKLREKSRNKKTIKESIG